MVHHMGIQVITADRRQHASQIRELLREYLQWGNARVQEEYHVSLDIAAMLDDDLDDLGKFMPPNGRLLLGYVDTDLSGIACLKPLMPAIGEIKRMYVRPGHRRAGLGRMLIQQLLQEAQRIGYQRIRLDSARFMTAAHALYRASGFKEIEAYEGSEVPKEFQAHWVFMEMALEAPASRAEGRAG